MRILVLLLALATPVVAWLSQTGTFGPDQGTISDRYPTLLVAAGWAFSIWSLIFVLDIVHGVLQATVSAPALTIGTNTLPLTIGGQSSGGKSFRGIIDDVYVQGIALDGEAVAALAGVPLDSDGDGVADAEDVFPENPSEWLDSDDDGIGDNADLDDDNDGIPDDWELLYGLDPFDSSDANQDANGDGDDRCSNEAGVLSEGRANALRAALIERGVDPDTYRSALSRTTSISCEICYD